MSDATKLTAFVKWPCTVFSKFTAFTKRTHVRCHYIRATASPCSHLVTLYRFFYEYKERIREKTWVVVDSNHRSNLQQIYSLSPLATRETTHPLKENYPLEKWKLQGSNL